PKRSIHGIVGDVWVNFHGAPPSLANDNQTLNLGQGQDPNRSVQPLPCVNATPGVVISHVGIRDTSFHTCRALGEVDSRLPSVSSGTHGLVDSGAHEMVLRTVGVSHANVGIHAILMMQLLKILMFLSR
ncbi:hypothetical protein PanWU01x14_320960, partial [Parasponia andersonii]